MVWSAGLAYVVGLITTDGCLSKDGRHIDLTSKDLDQIQTFAKILNLKNKIGVKSGGFPNKKTYCYRIQFGDIKFYKFLLKIGLTPHKSKTLGPLKIPNQYFADFLRGHLDGDGCTYSYWDKRWRSSFMLYTLFVSMSRPHLEWIMQKIEKNFSIVGKIRGSGAKGICYQLAYAKWNSVRLLQRLYYKANLPCLERKRSKIMDSLGIISEQAQVA